MIIAACSCYQQFTIDTIEGMNTHGLGGGGHRWTFVRDIIVTEEIDAVCKALSARKLSCVSVGIDP